MSRRREFSKAVKIEIVKRAMLKSGEVACEGCGLILAGKKYHIDHIKPDAMEIDKSRKLTATDGQLLGVECCHKPKTAQQDIPAIAAAKRVEAKHLGVKSQKQKIPTRPKHAARPRRLWHPRQEARSRSHGNCAPRNHEML